MYSYHTQCHKCNFYRTSIILHYSLRKQKKMDLHFSCSTSKKTAVKYKQMPTASGTVGNFTILIHNPTVELPSVKLWHFQQIARPSFVLIIFLLHNERTRRCSLTASVCGQARTHGGVRRGMERPLTNCAGVRTVMW